MHKRVIDGGSLWTSDKLATVDARFRAEYANLIPLATSNGTFDANPKKIHRLVYAYNRPEVNVGQVGEILEAFENAKMLFRWKEGGKIWGYFVGISAPGRLPSPSHRKNERVEVEVPQDQLDSFLTGNEDLPKAEDCFTQGQPKEEACATQGSSRVALALALALDRDVHSDPEPAAPESVSKAFVEENLSLHGLVSHESLAPSPCTAPLPTFTTSTTDAPALEAKTSKQERATDAQAVELYKLYPRHDAKADALRAFRLAVEKVAVREGLSIFDACDWMADRVRAFTSVQLAKPKEKHEFIPLPATWCNKERYDDEGLIATAKPVWIACDWDEAQTAEYQATMADYHAKHAGPDAGGGL